MAQILPSPCPVCGNQVECGTSGLFKKRLKAPNHCMNCGTPLHTVCPQCRKALGHLAPFCPHCGTQLYAAASSPVGVSAGPASGRRQDTIPAEQKEALKQFLIDMKDICVFLKEAFVVSVRFNPIAVNLIELSETLESITEQTPNDQRTRIVSNAIQQSDLSNAKDTMQEHVDAFMTYLSETIRSWSKDLEKTLPGYQQKIRGLPDFEAMEERYRRRFSQALAGSTESFHSLKSKSRQLLDFLPRYNEIMNRSGFFELALGFLSGWFGGPLGAAGAELWGDWREKSDKEFLQSFEMAVADFFETGGSLCESMEQAVDPIAAQLCSETLDFGKTLVKGLAPLVAAGLDARQILTRLTVSDHPLTEEDRDYINLVISNLKEQNLDFRAETNLRRLLGLT